MPSLRDIRRRIRSIKNTAQITKAMEMVAASRMRRAQQRVTSARPYSETMRSLIQELASSVGSSAGAELHPLLVQRPIDTVGIVLFTTNRGLCGGLNTNLLRRGSELMLEQTHPIELMTVGRKGQDFMSRRGHKLLGTFTGISDSPSYDDIIPVARVILDSYNAGVMDRCYLVYPKFVNTLTQRPQVDQLLPLQPTSGAETKPLDYIFEPDPSAILEHLMPRFIEVQIYQALLETQASEQSARMIAMRNATDNATEIVDSLTLTYNKARQAAITREVTEIASAAEAMAASAR
ncbi:MAG TPA: ATP synthase F1 subunit gamma [Chloroflexota bacterium]|jgi:F-type H+-transporting ATPase subunit gamma|nr:ATP synthase F1 subunit gamma [Chloroflexota bacterium]